MPYILYLLALPYDICDLYNSVVVAIIEQFLIIGYVFKHLISRLLIVVLNVVVKLANGHLH